MADDLNPQVSFNIIDVIVASVNLDWTAQNMQSDLWSTLSTLLKHYRQKKAIIF